MTDDTDRDSRVADFARRCLASLTPEKRAECDLLASAGERGMRVFPSEQYPEWCELVWGGQVVGVTTWKWLSDGDATRPPAGPLGYDGQ